MAKVSTFSFTVKYGADWETVNMSVHYNPSNQSFFARIPDKYIELFNSVGKDGVKHLQVYHETTKKGYHATSEWIVRGITEQGVRSLSEAAINWIANQLVETTKVILIHFEQPDLSGDHNWARYNNQHKPIGLELGLTYAEKRGVPGGNPVYTVIGTGKRFETKNHYKKFIEIPDTEDSRRNLEKLYTILYELCAKLGEYLKDRDAVLELVSRTTGIKLLESNEVEVVTQNKL